MAAQEVRISSYGLNGMNLRGIPTGVLPLRAKMNLKSSGFVMILRAIEGYQLGSL